METDKPLNSRCIFYDRGKCAFVASYLTDCHLCFNFAEVGGSRGQILSLLSYIQELGLVDSIFPKGTSNQSTLEML